MAKLKNPILSLGSRGSIGNAITTQRSNGQNIVRSKPTPTDPYSLPQAYQRWDYRDYTLLWHTLTTSEKQVYQSAGSRYHLTGFAYFMRQMLRTNPLPVFRYRLDEKLGAVAYDVSPHLNHAAIFGASSTPGQIDYARDFDGIDDRIVVPHQPFLNITDDIAFDCFIYPRSFGEGNFGRVFWKFASYGLYVVQAAAGLNLHLFGVTGTDFNSNPNIITLNQCQHIAIRRQRATGQVEFYIDGVLSGNPIGGNEAITLSGNDLFIGNQPDLARTFDGWIDHPTLYDEYLDPSIIRSHAERSYPP